MTSHPFLPRPSAGLFSVRRAAGILVLLSLAGGSALGASAPAAASTPTLVVDAPARAAVGERLMVHLAVRDVRDLAAYEARLTFDRSAARFSSLQQRQNDIARLGREVGALGPVEVADGVTFGAYSCPTADCLTREGRARTATKAGTLRLATVEIVVERAGVLQLDFQGLRFADSSGRSVAVDTSAHRITVQVGNGRGLNAAPANAARLKAALPHRVADVNGDGIVSHADVLAVRSAWTSARQSTAPCAPLDASNEDVDRNGCIDVLDVQTVAGAMAGPGTRRPGFRSADANVVPDALSTWIVDSTSNMADAGDKVNNAQDTPNGVCATPGGMCTLRAAIFEANRHDGPDLIKFAIPDAQAFPNATDPNRVWRLDIPLSNPLPRIEDETGATSIDGYTQPGAVENTAVRTTNAKLKIEIRGPGEGETPASEIYGLEITSPRNTVRGLSMYQLWKKIHLLGLYHEPNGDPTTPNANNNRIVGNFIGTDATGTYHYTVNRNRTAGVYLEDAAGNDIGGTAVADRNLVSGNQWTGVYTTGEAANGNRITGNLVGLTPSGTGRLANLVIGIDINLGSSRNVISGNVTSGNGREGIEVSHGLTTADNVIFGNYIGTFPAGGGASTATGNGWDTASDSGGVKIEDGAHGTLFHDNVVAGNYLHGIFIQGGLNTATGEIHHAHHNQIYDNRIGVGVGGQAIPNVCNANNPGCAKIGVRIQAFARSNTVGPGNEIANWDYAVYVDGNDSDLNTITRNSMHDNKRGIELTPIGQHVNGSNGLPPADGPNDNLDQPMIATATTASVTGQTCVACTVEVFIAQGVADAYGQGRTFIGSATADAAGRFDASIAGAVVGDFVTATATDSVGDTSEFALDQKVIATALPPAGKVLAKDAFTRFATDAWGNADTGGSYRLHTPGGTSADYDIGSGVGTMSVPRGSTRIATLSSISLQDVDARFRIRFDHLAAGGDQYAYLVARQAVDGSEYRLRVRLVPSGGVRLTVRRYLDGVESGVGGEVLVPGLTLTISTWMFVRFQVSGSGPTHFGIKAWRQADIEPAAWAYTATDAEARLQQSGPVALRGFVAATSSNTRVLYAIDDLTITAADPTAVP